MSDFNPENAVAVNQTKTGTALADTGSFNVENAVPVDTTHEGNSAWDNFRQEAPPQQDKSKMTDQELEDQGESAYAELRKGNGSDNGDRASTSPYSANKGQSRGTSGALDDQVPQKGVSKTGKPYTEVIGPSQYPDEGWLNTFISQAVEKPTWDMIAKPLMGKEWYDKVGGQDVDKYLADMEKQHPIASTLAGTAPYIATAPFFPESLIGVTSNFAAVSGISALGKARTEDALKPFSEKAWDIVKETGEGAAYGPIWHYTAGLGWVGRALTRGAGVTTLSAMFGNNLAESFRQGGMISGLSLIFENPMLAKTALGRGLVERANTFTYESMFGGEAATKIAQTSKPTKIYPDGSPDDIKSGILDVVSKMAKKVFPGPKIASATIQIKDNKVEVLKDAHNSVKADITAAGHNLGNVNTVMNDYQKANKPFSDFYKFLQAANPDPKSKVRSPDFINNLKSIYDAGQTIGQTGSQIHGTSHDDALSRIDVKKGADWETSRDIDNILDWEQNQQDGGHQAFGEKGPQGDQTHMYPTSGHSAEMQAAVKDLGSYDKVYSALKKRQSGDKLTAKQKKHTDAILEGYRKNLRAQVDPIMFSPDGELFEDPAHLWQEGNQYDAGFTTLHPDGHTDFITREESKEAPYNLQHGHSEDVPGLNESKFSDQASDPKIVNPDTLKDRSGEEGKVDIGMLPFVPETAEILSRSHQELKEKFAPYKIGQEGEFTSGALRENLGILARNYDRAEAALSKAKKTFDKLKKDDSLDFINRMETGQRQQSPELQKIADVLRDLLDSNRDEVIGLGTGKLEHWIENYFPHVWEDPNKVGKIIGRIMGRRPFEGPKSFLKKRTIPTTQEGIDLGFTPVSYNPVDSVLLKVREMQRYIMAHKTINALKDQGLIKFVRVGGKVPDGFIKIDDRFADVTYKNEAGELVIGGKYYAQENAGRILNNYLSPGLRGRSYIYDMYRGAGNTLNQFQLGISAFHLGFTSMDATISKFALGINKLSTGDFAGAIKEFGKAPFAPITNILQGRDLLQAWYGKDKGELTNTIADLMASGGGRAKMDKFYATHAKDAMMKSIQEGKIATAALRVPFYIVEQVARPIMEYIVPRQKMGVFADMMKMEMERNPGMSHEEMRGLAQKAWDSVDNRMGQLVYDNLFWNRTTKDLAMASVRSLGWNLGTIRELGGGVKDVVGNVDDLIHGKGTRMSYRTAYVMALPIVTGLYGAIYQYLHTGKGPQDLKDYFFPKNGAVDNKGQEARVSLPTYMKDIYHYTTNPVQTVINKFSPVNNAVLEMLNNETFYHEEIRNVDDPILQQLLDESKFVASQFEPFGFRNLGRDTRTSAGSKVEPFIGITPAPYDINMTKAEREASEFQKGNIPPGKRTKAQAQHLRDKSKLRSDYMASGDKGPLDDAQEQGIISNKEKKQLIKEAAMTPMERATHGLTFEQTEHLLKVATPSEKEELQKILKKKKFNKERSGTWTSAEEDLYDKTSKSEQ